jgi:hypothetical protein
MMIDILGKTLVAACTALSLVFFGVALAVLAFPVDPGWRSPRTEFGERVPSELDQRAAAVQQVQNARATAEKNLEIAQNQLTQTRVAYFNSHVAGQAKLDELATSANPKLQVRHVNVDKGKVQTDNFGRPDFKGEAVFKYKDGKDEKTVKVTKSLKEYRKELADLDQEIIAATKALTAEYGRQEEITLKIGGKTNPVTNAKVIPGMYDLIEGETALQNQLRRSIEDIRPRWVRHLVEVQLLSERREQLEARLRELQTKTARDGK